ncbi:uncharacterized protein OCT59_026874 [Rhizophagus irregularis]|uniref:Sequence orphan n=2 Tax=Rhizophagus irregularis TaxID=588596 RepID=A0A916E2W5_9GLOM|nr:hypothetical protein OCT59_026874 [Rhizophagus irregularis]CAB4482596.1 unnamed protein product [Rhizophagus irregularis]CAB5357985.1 unnamed protein product [Rhizophagus irregularis]
MELYQETNQNNNGDNNQNQIEENFTYEERNRTLIVALAVREACDVASYGNKQHDWEAARRVISHNKLLTCSEKSMIINLLKCNQSICYEHPDPFNYFHVERIPCSYTNNSSQQDPQTSQKAPINYDENMFNITFHCDNKDLVLCDKAKKTFEIAGQIISETLILNTKINVNATFIDLCETDKERCKNTPFRRIMGAAGPARSIILRDDDGVDRLYPQSLVKQFRFKQHPEYGEFDIRARFNSKIDYWFIEDNSTIGKNQIDFLYVVLHEFIHGLGFLSAWNDKIHKALTPKILSNNLIIKNDNNSIENLYIFNGFIEKVFDKYIYFKSTNERLSDVITPQLQKFSPKKTFSIYEEIYNYFKESSEYYVAQYLYKLACKPSTLIFKSHDKKNITLETSLNPFSRSSLNHLQFSTYTRTKDFLMRPGVVAGRSIQYQLDKSGDYSGGPIGPQLKLILETLGYATRDHPLPYKPSPIYSININWCNSEDFTKTMKCIANTNQARLLLQIEGSLIESLLTLLLFNILLV